MKTGETGPGVSVAPCRTALLQATKSAATSWSSGGWPDVPHTAGSRHLRPSVCVCLCVCGIMYKHCHLQALYDWLISADATEVLVAPCT